MPFHRSSCVESLHVRHSLTASNIARIGRVFPLAFVILLSGCGGRSYSGPVNFVNLVRKVRATVVNVSFAPRMPSSDDVHGSKVPQHAGEPLWLRKYLARLNQQAPGVAHGEASGTGWPLGQYGDRNERSGAAYRSAGSGVILSSNGYILTEDHKMFRSGRIVVRFSSGHVSQARLVGVDRASNLALLKVDAHGLVAASTADDQAPKVGEWVLSIGLQPRSGQTVTAGIVSGVHREFSSEPYVPLIQTDAIIGPGDFGGPLFNARGQVIGIASRAPKDAAGLTGQTFAVPIGLAMKVANELKTTGKVTRGWLGVVVQEVTPDLAESFGMNIPHGALVTHVMHDSPAAQSGLQPGDVILSFNGKTLRSSSDLPPLVGDSGPGQTVGLRVLRNGKIVMLKVQLGSLVRFGQSIGNHQSNAGKPPSSRSASPPDADTGLVLQALELRRYAARSVRSSLDSFAAVASVGVRK